MPSKKTMPPKQSLPLDSFWQDEEQYVQSLLKFATSSDLFINLCGGVHILDFFISEPDLYTTLLPEQWRDWFDRVDIHGIIQVLLHMEIEQLLSRDPQTWQDFPMPPQSLADYAVTIRRHCLSRTFAPPPSPKPESTTTVQRLTVGMKPKKIHEVRHFAAYINQLRSVVAEVTGQPVDGVVDFGSGQNYLGRVLASHPYDLDVIAVERSHQNTAGAKSMDIHARLSEKELIMRNKKEYRRERSFGQVQGAMGHHALATVPAKDGQQGDAVSTKGSIRYVEHEIESGCLDKILHSQLSSDKNSKALSPMVISLHSCGNLSHHGLRTLTPSLNPTISAVALVGCCYNLVGQRSKSVTYKHPTLLRHLHPTLSATRLADDPKGFPMSERLAQYRHRNGETGISFNITARMMAVQAPYNWGKDDCDLFFTRHYYRALLQKVLVDMGIIKQPMEDGHPAVKEKTQIGTTLTLGSLPRSAYHSFPAYGETAVRKLMRSCQLENLAKARLTLLTRDVFLNYDQHLAVRRKQLAIIWTLMAFSSSVVENVFVVDRYLWLKEQVGWIGKCWVETVFDYAVSPRNLVVVGIRNQNLSKLD